MAGDFLSSFTSSCVKHIEVTGTQKAGARCWEERKEQEQVVQGGQGRAGGLQGLGLGGPWQPGGPVQVARPPLAAGLQEPGRTEGWEPYGAGRQPGGRGRWGGHILHYWNLPEQAGGEEVGGSGGLARSSH